MAVWLFITNCRGRNHLTNDLWTGHDLGFSILDPLNRNTVAPCRYPFSEEGLVALSNLSPVSSASSRTDSSQRLRDHKGLLTRGDTTMARDAVPLGGFPSCPLLSCA